LQAKDLVQQILTFSRNEELETTLMRITHNIDSRCGIINADPTRIHQLIMNLLTNAYHAIGNNVGRITVELKEVVLEPVELMNHNMTAGTYNCVTVSDTGTGMNARTKERIFEPFFTTKEKDKGTGMGLSVVHGIIETMNGGIKIFSEPGKGTEISIYIPVEKGCFKENSAQTKKTVEGGNEKILLIDD